MSSLRTLHRQTIAVLHAQFFASPACVHICAGACLGGFTGRWRAEVNFGCCSSRNVCFFAGGGEVLGVQPGSSRMHARQLLYHQAIAPALTLFVFVSEAGSQIAYVNVRPAMLTLNFICLHFPSICNTTLRFHACATTLRSCTAGDWTRGLPHARQILYQLNPSPRWVFCSIALHFIPLGKSNSRNLARLAARKSPQTCIHFPQCRTIGKCSFSLRCWDPSSGPQADATSALTHGATSALTHGAASPVPPSASYMGARVQTHIY